MRFDGWFVSGDPATAGGAVDAVSRGGQRDVAREPLSFKAAPGPGPGKGGGAGPGTGSPAAERHEQARSSSALVTAALVIVAACAAIVYATMRSEGEHAIAGPVAAASAAPVPHVHKTDPVAAARFSRPAATSCDGRLRCSQMNSCAEAKYFLANCPAAAAEMDSNRNGIPCDTQWCTAGAADQAAP